ncbi:tyrosine--tRNA ligase [Bremerella sp. TYQ1]|uniref:tyrosine--tRNA ligase n=1 Tax=Bremerella sp. TYQ1 TaxID=3119568 RepID=UPI001CD018E7|nr:tyrosine--tRNA ligase [Bremerella volcania]UBM38908.1 tyrosine--tRNA ligase [Bremerella volcania]
MKDIFAELSWRGLINQTTGDDSFGTWLNEQSRTVYAGFDPTAESLHVGHMLPLMLLRRFQAAGHKPIALVGGATGMIGDPSGKSAERNLLSVDQLRANVDAIKVQMGQFLDFEEAGSGAVLVNNFDWMQSFSYLDFLRDIGKNFPVNVMMAKDSVKGRLERDDAGLSYTEFSYMLLQAYDFVHLYDKHGCTLQIGGSDQWGNITAGIDLGRRMRSAQLFGMTCPLLTKSDGTKMGKTESGAIWLSADRTSPYAFYQYWINVADEDAGKCLRFLTELEREEIESLDKAREEEPHKRQSQKRLAEALTELVHGKQGVESALRATDIFFGGEIDNLSDKQLIEIFADVPSQELSRDRLAADGGLNIVDALVESGLCKSKGDARRTISQGGAYVNNRRVEEVERSLGTTDLASETVMVLRSGKKKYALLRFAGE